MLLRLHLLVHSLSMLSNMKKSIIGGNQHLDYFWDLGELPVYIIGGVGRSVSQRHDGLSMVRFGGSAHSCAKIQDVVK